MRANNPRMELELPLFFGSALGYIALFALLALWYLGRRDSRE